MARSVRSQEGRVKGAADSVTVSTIIPTYNEAENLPLLLLRLTELSREMDLVIEVIVVDDSSPDGTGQVAEDLSGWLSQSMSITVLHRPEKAGLSSALLDGVRLSKGDYIVIMDADHSHDVAYLHAMLAEARNGADVVVGSRYVDGGKILDWPLGRRLVSIGATSIARLLFGLSVKDPMSGYVVFHRKVFEKLPYGLNPNCYKLLLEVLVRSRPARIVEIPITFRDRENGESKLSMAQVIEYIRLVAALLRNASSSDTVVGETS